MSIWHLILLFFIILLIFGPQRLEGIGTSLGRAVRGFKKGLDGEDEPAVKTETTQTASKVTHVMDNSVPVTTVTTVTKKTSDG